jgi:spore coat protein A
MISRRQFFKLSAATSVGLAVGGRLGTWNARPGLAQGLVQGPPLGGNQILQFVDPLPDLANGGLHAINKTDITLNMEEFQYQVMPTGFVPANGLPYTGTYVWGYREAGQPATSYIGPVVLATRGNPTKMKFVNKLGDTNSIRIAAWVTSTDQTLHWADPKGEHHMMPMGNYAGPIPAVVHLHGGEVPPQLDGGPDAWYLSDAGGWSGYSQHGHAYYTSKVAGDSAGPNEAIFRYPNSQEGANIWFHDHALGITRLNVYAGMAGAYVLDEPGLWAPAGPKPSPIPLVIQDRMFDVNGQLFFPNVGLNPEHPFWVPEFVGDTIVVNGKVWPVKAVDRQRYTLLFLNGSNARFYDMFFIDPVSGVKGPPMYVISTDGGYLANPVRIDPNATGRQSKAGIAKSLIVGPGERYEAIVDFNDATWLASIAAGYAALGQPVPTTLSLHLRNNARTPFPGGAPAQNSTTGRILAFSVNLTPPTAADASFDPAGLAALRTRDIVRLPGTPKGPAIVPGPTGTVNVHRFRQLTLNEVMGPGGPLEVLVNNTKWSGESSRTYGDFEPVTNPDSSITYYSELPYEGETELWEIINLTADAHPIHLHLVQFQLMNRQRFDNAGYTAAYNAAFPGIAGDPVGGMFIPAFGPPLDTRTGAGNHATYGQPILGGNPDVTPFLNAKKWPAVPPLPSEEGWKDTVIMYPGEVTRIVVRWAPTDVAVGDTANEHFPFDPNGGHGYVWHCHIIDHEDNEMMRPDRVIAKGVGRSYVEGTHY